MYSVDRAVDETVKWYRQRATAGAGFAAREMCLAQIDAYERVSSLRI
jgi:hypothetical protein